RQLRASACSVVSTAVQPEAASAWVSVSRPGLVGRCSPSFRNRFSDSVIFFSHWLHGMLVTVVSQQHVLSIYYCLSMERSTADGVYGNEGGFGVVQLQIDAIMLVPQQ